MGACGVNGTVYGVVLNDRDECAALAGVFAEKPYVAAPLAPVLYIKSRNTLATSPALVQLPESCACLQAHVTLALLLGRAATRVDAADALRYVAGYALAIDACEPHESYFRPAVRQRCRDGFLPLGNFRAKPPDLLGGVIETLVDGVVRHRRDLSTLHRAPTKLIADISEFMTLDAGDVLLVGLSGDAPFVSAGQRVEGRLQDLSPVVATILEAGAQA